MELNDRLLNAMTALSAYLAAKGDVCDAEQLTEEEMGDLVADLRHLAAARGLDWERVSALASLHYAAERGDADQALDAAHHAGADVLSR